MATNISEVIQRGGSNVADVGATLYAAGRDAKADSQKDRQLSQADRQLDQADRGQDLQARQGARADAQGARAERTTALAEAESKAAATARANVTVDAISKSYAGATQNIVRIQNQMDKAKDADDGAAVAKLLQQRSVAEQKAGDLAMQVLRDENLAAALHFSDETNPEMISQMLASVGNSIQQPGAEDNLHRLIQSRAAVSNEREQSKAYNTARGALQAQVDIADESATGSALVNPKTGKAAANPIVALGSSFIEGLGSKEQKAQYVDLVETYSPALLERDMGTLANFAQVAISDGYDAGKMRDVARTLTKEMGAESPATVLLEAMVNEAQAASDGVFWGKTKKAEVQAFAKGMLLKLETKKLQARQNSGGTD